MKRLLIISAALSVALLLGGCAIDPGYRYSGGNGAYYYGEAPYGGASTVIYGNGYYSPWGGPWGYGGYFGPGWGYGGVGFGTTIYYSGHHRYRGPGWRGHRGWHGSSRPYRGHRGGPPHHGGHEHHARGH